MKRKRGKALLRMGLLCLAAALCLCGWNWWDDRRAGAAAEELLAQVETRIKSSAAQETALAQPEAPPAQPGPSETEMTEAEIDGHAYIGYLSIPALELELPVMSGWSHTQLRLAPCRYYGSAKTEDLVIAAHNYSRHFGGIGSLPAGAEVCFTDMDGHVTVYEVAQTEILGPDDVEKMTSSGYALTLFTCTPDSLKRVAVRCSAAG